MARPTEYDALTVLGKITDYLDECKQQSFIPQIAGLAVRLGVSRSTLYDWADPKSERYHEEFSDILEMLMAQQEAQVIQNALVGMYNSTMAKLLLTKHGYVDKAQTDITTGGEKLTVQPILYANDTTAVEVPATTVPTTPPESA